MAFCGNCGTQAQDGTKFCASCGQQIAVEAPPVAQAAPPETQAPPVAAAEVPPPQQPQVPPPVAQAAPPQQTQAPPPVAQAPPPQQAEAPPTGAGAAPNEGGKDAEENKTMAILAYILFFIPLATGAHKTSPFVKYHTNQGTALFILAVAYSIVGAILRSVIKVPYSFLGVITHYGTPGWLNAILWLGNLGILALCILGIINANNGKTKPLPITGGFTIIK